MTYRDKIKSKISALKSKATAAGCTEAEAMAAAELAAKLMQSHGLSEAEIEYISAKTRSARDMARWQRQLLFAICKCTNTACIHINADINEIEFSGKEHAVEIAMYLRDVLNRAVNAEIRKMKAELPFRRLRKASSKAAATTNFAFGMVGRIQRKLEALFRDTKNVNELAVAQQCLDAKYPEATISKSKPLNLAYNAAYFAGVKAGDTLNLSHGVTSKSITQALIGRS